jgi:hypothetical protein
LKQSFNEFYQAESRSIRRARAHPAGEFNTGTMTDPEKIDQADRAFMEKLERLRTRLAERQAGQKSKKIFSGLFKTLIPVLLLAAGLGSYIFFNRRTAPPAAVAPRPADSATSTAGLAARPTTVQPKGGKPVAAQRMETALAPPQNPPQPRTLPAQASAGVPHSKADRMHG